MVQLLDKQKKEIVSILKPALGNTHQAREAFLTLALSGTRVLDRIEYSGPNSVFLPNLINTLIDYGEIEKGKEAIWVVLEAVRENMGVDYQERIDALRPIFEKPSVYVPSTVEPESVKIEDKSEVKQYLNRPSLNKSPEQQTSIEGGGAQSFQTLSTKEQPAEKQIVPIESAREYVESMRPVPSDLPNIYMAPCLVSNGLYYSFVCANSDWRKAQGNADNNYLKHWTEGAPRTEDLRLPVTNISFCAAKAFAEWLSDLSFTKVRLPKLEEWQIAASAGGSNWFEEAIATRRVNYFGTARHIHAVDAFEPNPYGIRDLIGQAFDMCFLDDHSSRPAIVGGCFHNTEEQLWSSLRGEEIKSDKICPPDSSFRCVRST